MFFDRRNVMVYFLLPCSITQPHNSKITITITINGKTISVLRQKRCYGLLFIAVLNLIKYDKTQTGRNSLERLLMAKNEEENENILPRLGEELEKVLMAEKYNLTTKNGKEHEKIQSWI